MVKIILCITALLGLAACRIVPPPGLDQAEWTPETALRRISPLRVEHEVSARDLRQAMAASLDYYRIVSGDTVFIFGPDRFTARDLAGFLQQLITALDEWGIGPRFYAFLQDQAAFYESTAQEVLVTGYFEIRLRGSLTRSERYSHPVYTTPPELLWLKMIPQLEKAPFYSRQQIDRLGVLQGRDLEVCWIDDPYRLFFLHIQGSGVVELDDGGRLNLNYAGRNGHPYHSIGRFIVDRYGVDIGTLSMQGIYDFLAANPDEADGIMDANPSYIFFRTVDAGPVGSLGRVLSPLCSIATDSRLFPKGALVFLQSALPVFDDQGRRTDWLRRSALVLNQDTGDAIRGPGRVDWFIGSDEAAEQTAGFLKQPGRLIFLAPKK